MRDRSRFVSSLLFAAFLLILLAATRSFWLRKLGEFLVRDERPEKAGAILVLGGDFTGARIMTACRLAQEGYAPVVLVSGAAKFYGVNEADTAIDYASKNGCPTRLFRPVYMDALSTADEADTFWPELQRLGVQSVLIVTSNFHTARAGRIFERKLAIPVRMVAAPDKYFSADGWWTNREGQKIAFNEYCKALAAATGI